MADAGRAMMLYRGLYDITHTYEKLDVVNFNGSLYISTTDGNLGTEPTEETKWKLFLQGGVSDNIQATDTYGLVGKKGDSSFVQLLLDSLASRVQGVALNRQTLGYSKKNLLKNTATSTTNNGVTFIVNEDGSVTVNGTATSVIYFDIMNQKAISKGKYIISGCPSNGSYNTYSFYAYDLVNGINLGRDYGEGREFNLVDTVQRVKATFMIAKDTTVENLTLYPMIRSAEITDGTYEPYVDDVDTRLQKIDDSILNTLEEIDANTFSENIAGALALKEVNSRLKSFGSTFSITTQGVIDCFELTKTDVYLCVTFTVAPSPAQANLYIAIGGPSGSLLFKVTENPDNIKLQLADNMLQLVSVYGNAGYVEIINFRHWK